MAHFATSSPSISPWPGDGQLCLLLPALLPLGQVCQHPPHHRTCLETCPWIEQSWEVGVSGVTGDTVIIFQRTQPGKGTTPPCQHGLHPETVPGKLSCAAFSGLSYLTLLLQHLCWDHLASLCLHIRCFFNLSISSKPLSHKLKIYTVSSCITSVWNHSSWFSSSKPLYKKYCLLCDINLHFHHCPHLNSLHLFQTECLNHHHNPFQGFLVYICFVFIFNSLRFQYKFSMICFLFAKHFDFVSFFWRRKKILQMIIFSSVCC